MSAESPRRSLHKGAQVISPQPVNDRSIIDSVAGIINDIVPQAYTGTPNVDNKESITWARFEYADVNDPVFYPDYNEGSSTPPLLLVLGYGTGVQVWLVTASGEATEVLSWRQGVVRTLRFLPNPKIGVDQLDLFESKRPMVAICDSTSPGPQFCNVGFVSLKTGEQVKSIKFKNPVSDILANRRSIVVTFAERIAVFDANNLEDVLTVTTCYPSPGPNPNPVALGTRWLAYSEKKLIPARRSSGGSEGEGAQSYTATVLHAAKSLGKGLRGLGETVASTLTGNTATPIAPNNIGFDGTQPGVVTILDLQAAKEEKETDDGTIETVLAHFTAHSDAIVAMTFDLTGALLMTADRRGHDFHVFRIQPHPGGPTLAAVHHLYVLHRGDTTAKVQDMTFSSDARWAAVSTVRGTTHVFPIAPYGGPIGVRTHSTPHVVNRLSRFHRSAGLTADGTRSHSPVAHVEIPLSVYPYSNPRLPPYPHPTILHPLAQIRQPSTLNHVNNQAQPRPQQQRQRLHSEDSGSLPLKICCCFAPQRAWLYAQRDTSNKVIKRAVDSLFIMACHGNMIQYDLDPKPTAGIPKEKICDDTMIELDVEAKGQWPLMRSANSLEIFPPLPPYSPLLNISMTPKNLPAIGSTEDQWLSQVEIVTHAGPHRRLWMGPQFVFKTYNAPSGVAVNLVEAEAIEVGVSGGSRPARSNPVNMPHTTTRPLVPVVIDGSGSSYEQSPRFLEAYGDSLENESTGVGGGESQLREDLAEAMLETAVAPHRVPGRRMVVERMGQPVAKVVNPLGTVITVTADDDDIGTGQCYENEDVVEPVRSLCALEGPASLDDYDQEYRPIKSLTEVCAEIRSTIDPAIDSISNEDTKEVIERKALYAEAAPLESKIIFKFDREEACRDVRMTLNLCAEAGKIPNSPMTQAKENPWSRGHMNRDDKVRESKIARAKYVVNYDEEQVVCTENNLASIADDEDSRAESEWNICIGKPEISKLPSETEQSMDSGKKFHPKSKTSKANAEDLSTFTSADENMETQLREKTGRKKNKNKSRNVNKVESSFETIKDSEMDAIKLKDAEVKNPEHCATKPAEQQIFTKPVDIRELRQPMQLDDVSCEYSILEKPEPFDKQSLSSNHSDEDLEHIQSSEVTTRISCSETSSDKFVELQERKSRRHRKTSMTTSSDDDMEHIQSSEISELSRINPIEMHDHSKIRVELDRPIEESFVQQTVLKETDENVFSQPNDSTKFELLESKLSNMECINELESVDKTISNDIQFLEYPESKVRVPGRQRSEIPNEGGSKVKQKVRCNKNRKTKEDIVVLVPPDTTENEVLLVDPSERDRQIWGKKKTVDEDVKDEMACREAQSARYPSLKDTVLIAKRAVSSESIEIIDIDAMRKAEMESEIDALTTCTLKYKISEPKQKPAAAKSRKSRKSTKYATDEICSDVLPRPGTLSLSKLKMLETEVSLKEQPTPPLERSSDNHVPLNSWSSIVKTKKDASAMEKNLVETPELDFGSGSKRELTIEYHESTNPDRDQDEQLSEVPEDIGRGIARLRLTPEPELDESPINQISSAAISPVLEKEINFNDTDSISRSAIESENNEVQPVLSICVMEEELPRLDVDEDCCEGKFQAAVMLSPGKNWSGKEASPESEVAESKQNDSDEKNAVDRNSMEDPNPGVNVMDTEEDSSAKENAEKCLGTVGSSSVKKGRSKKKKRR